MHLLYFVCVRIVNISFRKSEKNTEKQNTSEAKIEYIDEYRTSLRLDRTLCHIPRSQTCMALQKRDIHWRVAPFVLNIWVMATIHQELGNLLPAVSHGIVQWTVSRAVVLIHQGSSVNEMRTKQSVPVHHRKGQGGASLLVTFVQSSRRVLQQHHCHVQSSNGTSVVQGCTLR